MTGVEVLLKKNCAYSQAEKFVYVKQLMIVNENGGKYLVVRLVNKRAEQATGALLSVTQFDADGRSIASSDVHTVISAAAGFTDKPFVPETKIPLSENTADIRVAVVSADYGDYTYYAGKSDKVEYNGGGNDLDDMPAAQKAAYAARAGKSGITVARRRMKIPVLVVFALFIALALAVGAVYFHLKYFVEHEKTFLYSGVEYAFEDDDKSDGTNIYVVGYHGNRSRIVIPKAIEGHAVMGIRGGAFQGNKSLTYIGFESEIPIGAAAFDGCISLKTVEFDKITEIGVGAFHDCKRLSSVTITPEISLIPEDAFSGCSSLATVTVEESDALIKIGKRAFSNCTGLKSVDINRRIDYTYNDGSRNYFGGSSIGKLHIVDFDISETFAGRNRISSMFGFSQATTVTDVDLRSLVIDELERIPESFCANLPLTAFEVKSLTSSVVGANAFRGCNKLTAFTAPVAMTEIGAYAFYDSALTEFDGSALVYVDDYAFAECKDLKTFALSQNTALEALSFGAFMDCASLKSIFIPSGISSINPYVFYGCSSLDNIRFGKGAAIYYISDYAFAGCSALTEFNAPDDELTMIGSYAFADCTSMADFEFSSAVSIIDDYAFSGCTGFTELTVPDTVNMVGLGALQGCDSLESLTVPFVGNAAYINGYLAYTFGANSNYSSGKDYVPQSLKTVTVTNAPSVDVRAFYGCDALERVILPDTVTSIGDSAFYGCGKLEDLNLPVGVTEIGVRAFYGCSAFKSFTVPDSVTTIGSRAFDECDGLAEITVPFVGDGASDHYYAQNFTYIFGDEYDVPQSLKTVTVTKATTLGYYAFGECEYIEEINLPDTLLTVGDYAFNNCVSLTELTLPNSVLNVGYGAFGGCNALKELSIPFSGRSRSTIYDDDWNNWYYTTVAYTFSYRVPKSLKKVILTDCTYIPSRAFENCGYLEQIVLDCNVSMIAENAFDGCYRLYEVFNYSDSLTVREGVGIAESALKVHTDRNDEPLPQFTDGNGLRFVGDDDGNFYLLDYVGDSETVELPSSVASGEYSFAKYSLWRRLFEGNDEITSVTVPSGVTDIGEGAFANCTALESVAYASGSAVTAVNDYMFADCRRLYELTLPSGLTSIGICAFYDCVRLKKFTLPAAFPNGGIGDNAFYGCIKLFEIYNFGSINIELGSIDNGRIAEHARAVHTSANAAIDSVTVNGVQYMKLGDGSIDWWAVDYYGADGKLEIKPFNFNGATVNSIGIYESAFTGYSSIANVVISSAVKSVGREFADCYNLLSVSLTDGGVNSEMTIENGAFEDSNIESFYADVAISSIGTRAFAAGDLTSATFKKRVTTVKTNAFDGAGYGLSVTFADVGAMSSGAFTAASHLNSVTATGKVDKIDGNAFMETSVEKLTFADVGEIGASAFGNNRSLITAKFCNVEKTIGEEAFVNDVSLKTATFGSVVGIGKNSFFGCSLLESISLAQATSAISIGASAFENCRSLKSFSYDGQISEIGDGAFRSDSSLSRLSLAGATSVGAYAFYGCVALKTVEFNGNVGSIGERAFLDLNINSLTFGGTVGSIGAYAFNGNSFLYSVSFGDVTSIGSYAFANCNNLAEIEFGGTLGSIGSYVFQNCAVTELTLPDNLTAVPDYAFSNCRSLLKVTLPSKLASLSVNAFSGSYYILTVYNRSNLNVEDCFDSPLAIAATASKAQYGYYRYNQNGASIEFAEYDGKWHLFRITNAYSIIELPNEFTADGKKVTEYTIRKWAVISGYGLLADKAVTGIDSGAFSSYIYVYYKGTEAEWSKLVGANAVGGYVYYYSDCIHDDDYGRLWRYDNYGGVTRDTTYFDESEYTVTEQPTCVKQGKSEAVCKFCKKKFYQTLPVIPHAFGDDGKCSVCNSTRTVVASDNFTKLSVITNDSVYPFEISVGGEIKSTNAAYNTTATLTITAKRAMDVTFGVRVYSMYSYSYYSYMEIRHNGGLTDSIYQQNYVSLSFSLDEGDTLTFTYRKNNGSAVDDCAYIKDLTFIYATTEA